MEMKWKLVISLKVVPIPSSTATSTLLIDYSYSHSLHRSPIGILVLTYYIHILANIAKANLLEGSIYSQPYVSQLVQCTRMSHYKELLPSFSVSNIL